MCVPRLVLVAAALTGSTEALVLDQTLFIDGGEMTILQPNNTNFTQVNNDTVSLDLSQSWENGSVAPFMSTPKDNILVLNDQYLWPAPDNSSFYAAGGIISSLSFASPTAPPRSFTQYSLPDAGASGRGNWSTVPLAPASIYPSLRRPAGGLSAVAGSKAYILGGFQMLQSRALQPLPGMLTYDMAANQWANESAAGFSPTGTAIFGRMEHLPGFGAQGVLLALGGQIPDPSQPWTDEGLNLLDFGDVYVYDIAGRTWHHQKATGAAPGAVPDPRDMFCSAVLSDPGSGAYEILVYGGQRGGFVFSKDSPGRGPGVVGANRARGAVHVVTVRGFGWFRANDSSAPPRAGHSCDVAGAGGRQVLSVGGLDPGATPIGEGASLVPDPFPNTVGVFDAVEWRWKHWYDAAAAPYVQPDPVRAWYRQR